jgi:hypothetical protein
MRGIKFIILLIFLVSSGFFAVKCTMKKNGDQFIVLDSQGIPFIFELDPGESIRFSRSFMGRTVKRKIKLESVKLLHEPDYWFDDTTKRFDYYDAEIVLDVSGEKAMLHHRPYQMPITVNGLRIYIENIREWDEHGELGNTGDMKKSVRISVCLEGEPWGPEDILFPLSNYCWRASVYNNTWSGLVPFNLLYYHRGEDYGAIPDLLEVVSPVNGQVIRSPLPSGDGGSNTLSIRSKKGITFTFAHMNTETIADSLKIGQMVKTGDYLGKTGMTWDGRKSQHYDPHLHVEFTADNVHVATFPWMMEAYLRRYHDKVVAIAGGYRSAVPDEKIILDASRSFTADGTAPKRTSWNLSDGRVINDQVVTISYTQPGIYSEELTAVTDDGYCDKDFLYVIVFDAVRRRNIPHGWAYYYPVRDIHPGDRVLFWNRLMNIASDVLINFGDDGSWRIIKEETVHSYSNPGEYVVTIKATGSGKKPVTLKMAVTIDN